MGGVRDRLRTGLIVGELAVALVLLVGAGLLIRSSIALQRVQPGFDPHGVMSARLSLPAAEYAEPGRVVQTFERIAEAARQIPGVEPAAITSQVPMGAGGNGNGLVPEGRPFEPGNIDPQPAANRHARLHRDDAHPDSPRPRDSGRRPARRAEGDGDQRGARATRRSPATNPIGKRIACCEAGTRRQEPRLQDRRRRRRRRAVARPRRAAGSGVLSAGGAGARRRVGLDPADDVRRGADVDGSGDRGRCRCGRPSRRSLPAFRCSTSGRWSSGWGSRWRRRSSTRCC